MSKRDGPLRNALGINQPVDVLETRREAISQWRFKPAMKNRQPVAVSATVEVNWRLL